MPFIIMLFCLGAAWLISAWSFMLVVGMTHHDILPAVIPISYQTSLQVTGVLVAFTFVSMLISEFVKSVSE
jgi:hypothetical protein